MTSFSIVVPTLGRASLTRLLSSLARADGPPPQRLVLVDDRPDGAALSLPQLPGWPGERLTTLRTGGRGPAAARNAGHRAAAGEWTAFLDDDVVVSGTWLIDLAADLARVGPDVAGIQGVIKVPLPGDRRPTDWERGTAGLASARWITADMAYRRTAFDAVGGFDERFPRAFREDADLALRIGRGHRLVVGRRRTCHPVRPAPWHVSLGQQRGNADDALMRRLHGPAWHARAGAPVGRRRVHMLTTGAGLAALLGGGLRRRWASLAGAAWLLATAQFAWQRVRPGPRTWDEVTRMLATSVLIPPAATWHWLSGCVSSRHAGAWSPHRPPVQAVLFDRDGTLVHDVPYNGDPERVEPIAGAKEALDRLRAAGVKVGVVTNQSAIARGMLEPDDVARVNARVDQLLGPFDDWQVCPHAETDGCRCRKPAPRLIVRAAEALRVPVERCAVVGDIGSDVDAGTAAGVAATVLVPTPTTRPDEVARAPRTADTLRAAVDLLFADFAVGAPDGARVRT